MIPENELSLNTLATHLENSGWDVDLREDCLILHTERGLAFSVTPDETRKFIGFCTFLPVRSDFEERLEWVNRLNNEIFMTSFAFVDDRNLRIVYYMSYRGGLILGQFAYITRRYAGLIDLTRRSHDPEGLIFDIGEN